MPRPLLLMVFIHEDLSDYDKGDLYDDHFEWLPAEFKEISGRPMAIILISPSDAPKLSNHGYKNDNASQALLGWYEKVEEYKTSSLDYGYDDNTRKFLLLTRNNLSSSVAGIAAPTGHFAIASINHRAAAHEVGHMFDARHDDYDVLYNGWWDETIMAPGTGFSSLRGNANRFSDKNRENIREYLEQFD